MKILGVMRQFEGGGYYRIRQPLEELAKHGHDATHEMAKSTVTAQGRDVIVGHLIGNKAWWRNQIRYNARLVYDIDDDPFEVEPLNPAYECYSDPGTQDGIKHCIEIADLVTCSTEPLAERMSKINPNTVVLNNHIDEAMLKIQRPRREGKVVIGWAGSWSHYRDIPQCAYGWRRAIDRNPGKVESHMIGADWTRMIKRPDNFRYTGWTENTTDYYKTIDFDIGLAPLMPSVFAACKSHIKALEYAALGIPCIASDVEPYREFIIHGVTGYLCSRAHDWVFHLRDLINDDAMREEMSREARKWASQWTIQENWVQWEQAYKSVL
jgi:glycosyltransferase involved in cell wall biosynthesis